MRSLRRCIREQCDELWYEQAMLWIRRFSGGVGDDRND